jgi:hypothetical protein
LNETFVEVIKPSFATWVTVLVDTSFATEAAVPSSPKVELA